MTLDEGGPERGRSEEARAAARERIAAWEDKPEHKAKKLDARDRQTIDDPLPLTDEPDNDA